MDMLIPDDVADKVLHIWMETKDFWNLHQCSLSSFIFKEYFTDRWLFPY